LGLVDRDRTRFDAYAGLVVETAGVVGDVMERSRILEVLDAIAKIIWRSKKEEGTKELPAPSTPKRIERPRTSKPNSAKGDEMNDEVPF
jgi:hypothetical protein